MRGFIVIREIELPCSSQQVVAREGVGLSCSSVPPANILNVAGQDFEAQ